MADPIKLPPGATLVQQGGGGASTSMQLPPGATLEGGGAKQPGPPASTTPAPTSTPPAPEGLLHSLGATAGLTPENIEAKAQEQQAHPFLSALHDALPGFGMAENVVTAVPALAKKAMGEDTEAALAAKRGDFPGFLAHQAGAFGYTGATAAAPLFGEGPAKAGEQLGAGNIRGALGTTIGTLAPVVVGGELAGRGGKAPASAPFAKDAAVNTMRRVFNPNPTDARGFQNELRDQIDTLVAHGQKNGLPQSEFGIHDSVAKLARAAADADPYYKTRIEPFQHEIVSPRQIPGYRGALNGMDDTTIGDLNARLRTINATLQPKYARGPAGSPQQVAAVSAEQAAALQNEAAGIRTTLAKEISKRTGVPAEQIAAERRNYGQLANLADTMQYYADEITQRNIAEGKKPLTMRDVLPSLENPAGLFGRTRVNPKNWLNTPDARAVLNTFRTYKPMVQGAGVGGVGGNGPTTPSPAARPRTPPPSLPPQVLAVVGSSPEEIAANNARIQGNIAARTAARDAAQSRAQANTASHRGGAVSGRARLAPSSTGMAEVPVPPPTPAPNAGVPPSVAAATPSPTGPPPAVNEATAPSTLSGHNSISGGSLEELGRGATFKVNMKTGSFGSHGGSVDVGTGEAVIRQRPDGTLEVANNNSGAGDREVLQRFAAQAAEAYGKPGRSYGTIDMIHNATGQHGDVPLRRVADYLLRGNYRLAPRR